MTYGNNAIHVSEDSKMPKVPHWAIVGYETQYHEGDERSRTNPGHGYGAHTTQHCTYKAFLKQEDWEAEVKELASPKYGSPKPFMAMYVVPAQITTTVNVNVDIKPQQYGNSFGIAK
jgi:hypothetical protein